MAFEQLKERQSFAWGNGPFEEIADTIADIHRVVVDALQPGDGKRWLDVACGTGDLAMLAAASGADVVGVDFAAPLVETARRRAAEGALDIDFRVGDAESLDLEDASFDIVSSTFGVIFAPDQNRAAGELARVTRPGGLIGLATWTPDGTMGDMCRVMAQFQPPPPEGAGIPLDWGWPGRVEQLLGDAFDLQIEERNSTFEVESAEEYWTKFALACGPWKTLLETLDEDGREHVRRAFFDYMERYGSPGGPIAQRREYLLITGTRK
jgi:ubiquinone/menaquinone biosynthesis C-methylase UbiE